MEEAKAKLTEINLSDDPAVTLTIRLIMQGKEVGSIIGKKGEIVKRFREESPPKGATIPYRPKPQMNGPVIVANGQAYTIQGNYAVPAQETCTVFPLAIAGGLHAAAGISGLADPLLKGTHLQGAIPPHHLQPMPDVSLLVGGLAKNPLAGLAALGLAGAIPTNTGGLNPTGELVSPPSVASPIALAALAGSQLRTNNNRNAAVAQAAAAQVQSQSHEMTVPNDLIGCIIGKGGTKIAEIRQISGAMIRISNCEERDSGNTDRTITITGNPDSVALAQYLINMSVELQKANLGDESAAAAAAAGAGTGSAGNALLVAGGANGGAGGGGAAGSNGGSGAGSAAAGNPLASAIPLAQLLSKPGALNALTSLSALGGLTDLLGNLSSAGGAGGGGASGTGLGALQSTGINRPKTTRMRSPNNSNNSSGLNGDSTGKKSERNKFNPY
ncbi:poly(rC)-binding protein 2 isoform X15 [Culex pipiens pallens]|uniref:poly(rC)-binding protein 2 isoform X14 n=1 Tax=Culex pipiens pallens TaxID=42434 RepID=UPI0022AA53DE|nr:poly(rC)-binding protein 2 isoform X14 [Culex pipiens pallens]XP_052565524.1 poly(rC)-binding protein 2 isoform X15 [Culex pipiens pallens]